MERRIQPLSIEIRATENEPSIIFGYAARFNSLSSEMCGFSEKIAMGAFTRTLKENPDIKCLWNHNTNLVLGSTRGGSLKLYEDNLGLRFELDPGNTSWGKDAFESIRRGDVSGVSFGFCVVKQEWNGTDPENVIRTLMDVDLFEISPTPFPAYADTEVQVRTAYNQYLQANTDGIRSVKINENSKYLSELRRKIAAY